MGREIPWTDQDQRELERWWRQKDLEQAARKAAKKERKK